MNKNFATANLIARVALQIGVAIGVLITIIYCGSIEYYPAGLTIGDVLFFIAASLSFSFSYAFFVFALLCAGITISPVFRLLQKCLFAIPIIRKKLYNDKNELFMINFPELGWDKLLFVLVGLTVLVLILTTYHKDFDKGFGLTLAVLVMSFLYGLWHTKPLNLQNEKTEIKVKIGLAIMISMVPLLVTKSQGNILNQAMSLVGVRNENVVVQLTDKYNIFLSKNNITSSSSTASGEGIYNNTKILFRGIGEYAVLEIDGFRVIVPNKDLLIGKLVPSKDQ